MGRQEELQKLDRIIKDATIRLNTVQTNLSVIEKEIAVLEPLEASLEENVAFLRKTKIVAIAEEFKKAKADLDKTKIRLTAMRADKDRTLKSLKETQDLLGKAKKDFEELQKIGDNNVVRGKFGRKSDG